jgi:hypothetical protein
VDQTSQVTGRPYSEVNEEGYTIREFSKDTPSFEFVWHRDKEDRLVEAIGKTDWQVQLDNQLPMDITRIFIPKETYHRVIKGSGSLKVKIYKLHDNEGLRNND